MQDAVLQTDALVLILQASIMVRDLPVYAGEAEGMNLQVTEADVCDHVFSVLICSHLLKMQPRF